MNYYRPTRSKSSTSNPLRVLEIVAQLGTGTTAKDITDSLQMPQATAYRVINSLVADEYLVRTSDLRGFALGQAISGLVTAAAPVIVPTAARIAIEEFRRGKRFAVHLIMFRNPSLRIADEDPDYPLRSTFEMLRYPHASAAGKLMLAELGAEGSPPPKGALVKLTQNTITDRTQLEDQLAEIRVTGEASDINELEQGIASLALPVHLHGQPAGGAVCLASNPERFPTTRQHGEAARELASQLAPLLF